MAYTIQSIVATQGVFPSELPEGLVAIQLEQNIWMIPIGATVRQHYGIPFLPLTDEGSAELPSTLLSLCGGLSKTGAVAYIEAEIFGGTGTQACVLVRNATVVGQTIIAEDAINDALRWLGVHAGDETDEFASVGLGKYRDTDDWLNPQA